METAKLKNFGLYKGIIHLIMGLHIISLIWSLVILIASFLGMYLFFTNAINIEYANRHMTLFKPGHKNELYINKVLHREYFKTDTPEKHITLHSNSGNSYAARVPSAGSWSMFVSGGGALIIDIPDDMAKKMRIVFSLYCVGLYLLTLTILYKVRKILFSLKDGSSFTFKNAESISFIARIFLFLPVVHHIFIFLVNTFIESTFNILPVRHFWIMEFDAICLFVGLLIAILSYVLKQGIIMRQEQDLTI